MSDTKKVTYGKPKIGGAVSVAPFGTEIPTDAVSELPSGFRNLGYISEEGLTNANSPESDAIKAWGGDIVLVTQTDKPDNFSFTLIEALNVDVLKYVYGEDNVTGDLESGIEVRANAEELDSAVVVVDMVFQNALKRVVVPNTKITEVGEIVYNDTEAVGYEVTTQALPYEFVDEKVDTHREYIIGTNGATQTSSTTTASTSSTSTNKDDK